MLDIETLPKVRIVRVGDGFLFAACKLFENRSEGIDWSSPLIVNLALAIELYLKSYTAEDEEDKENGITLYNMDTTVYPVYIKSKHRDHKLEKLYGNIDNVIKEELDKKFFDSHLSEKFADLNTALSAFSDVFAKARYPYEKDGLKSICISDLYSIANFLKEAIYGIGEFVKDKKTNAFWKLQRS